MAFTNQITPDADPETNSFDGRVGREGATNTWAVIRSNAANVNDDSGNRVAMVLQSSATLDRWQALRRGFFLFYMPDVTFPTGTVVVSARISMFPELAIPDNFSTSLTITDADPASDTGVTNADYLSGIGSVEYTDGRVTLASMSSGVRFEFELNAVALAALATAIDGGLVFKTGLRFSHDFDNIEPTYVASKTDNVEIASGDHGTAARNPYLEVTYRIGPGNATVKVTGTKASAGDVLSIDAWSVEIFS